MDNKIQPTRNEIIGVVNSSTKAFEDISQFFKVFNSKQMLLGRLLRYQPATGIATATPKTNLEEELQHLNQKVTDMESVWPR